MKSTAFFQRYIRVHQLFMAALIVALIAPFSIVIIGTASAQEFGFSDVYPDSYGTSDVYPQSYGSSDVYSNSYGYADTYPQSYGSSDVYPNQESYGYADVYPYSYGSSDVYPNQIAYGYSDVYPNSYGTSYVYPTSYGTSDVYPYSYGVSDVYPASSGFASLGYSDDYPTAASYSGYASEPQGSVALYAQGYAPYSVIEGYDVYGFESYEQYGSFFEESVFTTDSFTTNVWHDATPYITVPYMPMYDPYVSHSNRAQFAAAAAQPLSYHYVHQSAYQNANQNINTISNSVSAAPAPRMAYYEAPVAQHAQPVYQQPVYPQVQHVYQAPPPQNAASYVQSPFVALSQIPYTGFDAGLASTLLYGSVLLVGALLAAYALIIYFPRYRPDLRSGNLMHIVMRWIRTELDRTVDMTPPEKKMSSLIFPQSIRQRGRVLHDRMIALEEMGDMPPRIIIQRV